MNTNPKTSTLKPHTSYLPPHTSYPKPHTSYLIPLLLFSLLLFPPNTSAQTTQFYSLEYSTGTLFGASHNFVEQYSWRGGHFNGQIFLIDHVAVGFKLGFNNYYSDVAARVYDYGNGLRVFANTFRYIRKSPFQVGAVGHLFPNRLVKPYLGVYLGLCYASESVMFQDIQIRAENYGFIISPELGLFVQFGKNSPTGAKLSVAYNYATNNYKFGMVEFKDLQSLNVNIGLTYMVNQKR